MEVNKENADENDGLIICYQSLSNYVLKMAFNHTQFAKNVQSEIIEPFQQVGKNFKDKNAEISSESFDVTNNSYSS